MTRQAVNSRGPRSLQVFSHYLLTLVWPIHCHNVEVRDLSRLSDRKLEDETHVRARRNWTRAGMVEWNGIIQLFRFSGISCQPREVHLKFQNEIPKMSVPLLPTRKFPEYLVEWKLFSYTCFYSRPSFAPT